MKTPECWAPAHQTKREAALRVEKVSMRRFACRLFARETRSVPSERRRLRRRQRRRLGRQRRRHGSAGNGDAGGVQAVRVSNTHKSYRTVLLLRQKSACRHSRSLRNRTANSVVCTTSVNWRGGVRQRNAPLHCRRVSHTYGDAACLNMLMDCRRSWHSYRWGVWSRLGRVCHCGSSCNRDNDSHRQETARN